MRSRQQPRHFGLMIFLILSIFMAAVAGPSAAIILILQLGWWPQPYNATYQKDPDILFEYFDHVTVAVPSQYIALTASQLFGTNRGAKSLMSGRRIPQHFRAN